jgi:rhodanese-related sulfurtransferase
VNRKKNVLNLIILLIFFTIPGFHGCKSQEEADNQNIADDISVSQAFELIQNNRDNENFIILDVRTLQEYREAHLEDAINIDYYSEDFQDRLSGLDKNKIYLVYCQSGNRSANAAAIMINLGFVELYNMLGGITAWISAGYPVISSSGSIGYLL